MDVIAKIDRTLLDNELRSIIRFTVFRESDRALFNPTYKIKIDNNLLYFTLGISFYAIPHDDTNRKFIIVSDKHVLEIERFTNSTLSIRSVESSLYEYEDPSLYKLLSTIVKLIKDRCNKNATKTR